MATADLTALSFLLKRRYPQRIVNNLTYPNNPAFARVSKDTDAGGESLSIPVIYGLPTGRSATFATAQSNVGAAAGVAFLLVTKNFAKDYGLLSLDGLTIRSMVGNEKAFLNAVTNATDNTIRGLKRSIGQAFFGDGSGKIGTVSSISSATITLSIKDEVTNFYKGMIIVAAADAATNPRSGTMTVNAVDESAGTITVDATVAGLAANDLLFAQGDYTAANDRKKIRGFAAWLPDAVPSSGDSFFSVDRSVDPTRLAGQRVTDMKGAPIDEILLELATFIGRAGGEPDVCYVSHESCRDLIKQLQAKKEYQPIKSQAADADVFFSGVRLVTPYGQIEVYPDVNCPSDRAYILTSRTWKLYSVGPCPGWLSEDGKQILRESSADAYEGRMGYYAQLACNAPGWNGVALLK